jgi:hypothetical protein
MPDASSDDARRGCADLSMPDTICDDARRGCVDLSMPEPSVMMPGEDVST